MTKTCETILACLIPCLLIWTKADVHQHVNELLHGTFPDGFLWSAASSAYQVEGGWNVDGKGMSIWDTFVREGYIYQNQTGDIACDSYHRYGQDVRILKQMGVTHYRFSIAWARLLPDGTTKVVNEKGVAYYNNIINALLRENIQPMVHLYHWDLPQTLQDQGGFFNDSFADWFNDYARLCYQRFGDRVKLWITFEEPWIISVLGHETGHFAPGIVETATGGYRAGHNLIKAHVKAYRTYQREFKSAQNGQVGIVLDTEWKEPLTNSTADVMAAERAMQFRFGWFANPIFGNGDYPDVMKQKIKLKSQGLESSRLPTFTAEEIRSNRGSADFLGLDQYTTHLISEQKFPVSPASSDNDQDVRVTVDPNWKRTAADWLNVAPWGMRRVLNWIKLHYDNPTVYVSENGRPQEPGTTEILHDPYRINYLKSYINEVLKAIRFDGCNIKGYAVWALMDNFEWRHGYSQTFGLHYVNFTDPVRPRLPRDSAKFFAGIIKDNGFRDPSVVNPIG